HLIPHHDLLLVIPVAKVEVLFVRRERKTVWASQVRGEELQSAVRPSIYAAERGLFAGVIEGFRQAKRRISEVERSVRFVHEIGRTVEPLALITVCENRQGAIFLETCHASVAVLIDRESILTIQGEAV